MRHFSVIAILILSVVPGTVSAKEKSWGGKWMIDKANSTAQAEIPDNFVQQIKQSGSKITIESGWHEPQNGIAPLLLLGVMATRVELVTDGTEKVNNLGPFVQNTKSTFDGSKLETVWTAVVNGEQVNGHWVRTLSDDAMHQTLQIKETSQGQTKEAKLVFNRK